MIRMAIKAIALDIDGTLTTDKKVIPRRTKQVLLAAQEAGITVILASGRPAYGLKGLAAELELDRHHGLLISFNGARVIDATTDEILFDQAMTADEVRSVLSHMKRFDVIPMVTHGRELCVKDAFAGPIMHRCKPVNIIRYEARACDLLVREVGDLAEFCHGPENKILTAGTDTYLQEHWREMYEPFKGRLSGMFTADFYFEFTAPGIDKGRALAGALPRRGIDASELVAFGDGQNDLAMIRFAGTGVAMGNAIPELKQAADMVTLSNNDEGVAAALEKLL